MAYPAPASPTLNDLTYDSYDRANPTKTASLIQGINTIENVVLQFVGYTYRENTSDFISAAESISLFVSRPGPEALIIYLGKTDGDNYADNITLSENVNFLDVDVERVSDTVTTAENVSLLRS